MEWRDGGNEDKFPILGIEWRIVRDIDGEADKYLEASEVPFSAESAHRVVNDGGQFVGKYDDVRFAASHAQEIHMRPMAPKAWNPRMLLGGEPELGGQISRIREAGELPHYGGPSMGRYLRPAFHTTSRKPISRWENLERCAHRTSPGRACG